MNKGDSTNWKYRSRYVAKEFNTRDQEEHKVIMVNDVARAFFEAPARRTICVELPEEKRHMREMTSDFYYKAFTGPGQSA